MLKMHERGLTNLKRARSSKHIAHFAAEVRVFRCWDCWISSVIKGARNQTQNEAKQDKNTASLGAANAMNVSTPPPHFHRALSLLIC